ncbi:MAG: endonuclease/exonuclease/phosphatase family protein [Vulcanimicrobiota bacterium]
MDISSVNNYYGSHNVNKHHHKKNHHHSDQNVRSDSVAIEGQRDDGADKALRAMRQDINRTESAEPPVSVHTSSVAVGDSKSTVSIGTFNVNWLGGEAGGGMKPRKEADYKDIASLIKDSGASVMGLEEVGSEDAIKRLINYLPGYDFVIGTTGVRDGGKSQKLVVLYDTAKVQCDKSSVEELKDVMVPEIAGEGRLRAPLAVKMKADNFDFTLVVCHMKARFDEQAKEIRSAQADKLNSWIQNKIKDGGEKDVIVVGDFNDFLGSIPLKKMESQLYFVTQEAAERGDYSNIKFKSLIDQIGVTSTPGGAKANYISQSVHMPDIGKYPNFVKRISDHRPVVATFRSDIDPNS